MTCCKCGKETADIFTTAYGEQRCDFCYDDYLMTDKGKVEYLIAITTNPKLISDYDADFLGHVSVCWRKYRDELKISLTEVNQIEAKARALGILD